MSLLVLINRVPMQMPEAQVLPKRHPVWGEEWFSRHLIEDRSCLVHAWLKTDLGTFIWTRPLNVTIDDSQLIFGMEEFKALQPFQAIGMWLLDEWSWFLSYKDYPIQPNLQVGDSARFNYALRVI